MFDLLRVDRVACDRHASAVAGMNRDVAMIPVHEGLACTNTAIGASLRVLPGKSEDEYLEFPATPEIEKSRLSNTAISRGPGPRSND